jgi:hypothetical protein
MYSQGTALRPSGFKPEACGRRGEKGLERPGGDRSGAEAHGSQTESGPTACQGNAVPPDVTPAAHAAG